jgi:hypothetical protein
MCKSSSPWVRQRLLRYNTKSINDKKKKIHWTLSKLKTFMSQKTPSSRFKDNPQKKKKYFQIVYQTRDMVIIKNSHT